MLEERGQSMEIRSYQGIAKIMPTFTLLFIISSLASVGLPGLNGFVGEFLILMGSFGSSTIGIGFAVLAAAGVIFAAVYMLWMIRRVFFGALAGENTLLTDIAPHQTVLVLPLLLIMLVTGFHATPLLEEIGKSTEPLVQVLLQATSAVALR
jgi:NADH-quinone oxidoreductase subunit M